jgi:CheY-like chemotaxis protein
MPGPRESSYAPPNECSHVRFFPEDGLDSAEDAERVVRQARLEELAPVVRQLAHDFGNILTGILGFSELSLSLLSLNSPAYQYATEIQRAAQQGAEFTQALRWFSRRANVRDACTSLADVIAQEAKQFREDCGASVRMQFEAAADLPTVAVESEALRQVLRQLLVNASDAISGAGTIRLTPRTTELSASECTRLFGGAQAGAFVAVEITDTGCGFSAEARQRLFVEPFFTTKMRRCGLGLAIVYGILHCHRGGFQIEDRPGGGTIVRVYLPVAVRTAPVAPPPASVAPRKLARILVVDDDPMVLQLVCTTLERAGYRVQAAASGAEALARYAAAGGSAYDLVLADLLMPRLSGIELARQLLGQDANVNFLFMSGQVAAEFAETDFLRGRFDLLSKPFRPEGLLRAVRHALERRPAQADTASTPLPASASS